MNPNHILGFDIGGTGIKGAIIDVTTGALVTERVKVLTPDPATPDAIGHAVQTITEQFEYKGIIGCGFPAIVKNGIALSAANIDKTWINVNVENLLSKYSACPVYVANDADVAGMAEQAFGFAANQPGVVLVLTIGTGIGSALFYNGQLIPNTEFGHLKFQKTIAEKYTSNVVRKEKHLTWEQFGGRLNEFLKHLEFIFSPNLFIIGGGISKKFDLYKEFFTLETSIVPAKFQNDAGVIGAALYAHRKKDTK